jgi:hypothetical protein
MLHRAAERGAERCLAHLGLENAHAARDIPELRDLLEAWRDARRTAWQTTVKVITTGVLAVLLVGAAMQVEADGRSAMSPIFTTLAPDIFEAGAKLIDRLIPDPAQCEQAESQQALQEMQVSL